jgi:hypothetical protein
MSEREFMQSGNHPPTPPAAATGKMARRDHDCPDQVLDALRTL